MKDRFYRLNNPIQPYAWGSETAIPELLGQPPRKGHPQAEMWMGAHPKAPSQVEWNGRQWRLDRFIHMDPPGILGPSVVDRFGDTLPFLFKVLAAGQPLSIQAHPDKAQAVKGYQHEEQKGIPLNAPHRNYKDANHKPECLCALTPFWAMCGFRDTADIIEYGRRLDLRNLDDLWPKLESHPAREGRRLLIRTLMGMPAEHKKAVMQELQTRLSSVADPDPAFQWMLRLLEDYPHDIGVLAPIYLNVFCLQPGEAVFLTAGVLHAYLEGVGIELMANSDNVLRGGLTPKHIDETELFRVVDFDACQVSILSPPNPDAAEHEYACPAAEFSLTLVRVASDQPRLSPRRRSVEILLCIEGRGHLHSPANGQLTAFRKGDAFLIPAGVESYDIEGQGTFYKAAVPHRQ